MRTAGLKTPWCPDSLPRLAFFLSLATCLGCGAAAQPPAPEVRMLLASQPSGGSQESLASHFISTLPNLKVSVQATGGSLEKVSALNTGKGDLAVAQADVVYTAYQRGMGEAEFPHNNLSAIAVLRMNTLYTFVRRGKGLHRIEDLRGKRLLVADRTGASEVTTRTMLAAHGMSYSDMHVTFAPVDEMGRRFADGSDDAMIVVGNSARTLSAPSDPHTLQLLPIDDKVITRLRATYPFLKPVIVPRGSLSGQDESVTAIGVDTLLICRKALDPDVVYDLTKELFTWPGLEDWDSRGPDRAAATPIPLHPGAARYYREQEVLR